LDTISSSLKKINCSTGLSGVSVRGLPLFEVSEGGALMPSAGRTRNLLASSPRLARFMVTSTDAVHSQPGSPFALFLGVYVQVIGRTLNGHPLFEKRDAPPVVGQEVTHTHTHTQPFTR